jgi:prepilin-type N-terminal cleavage/methylation domain-containing protein
MQNNSNDKNFTLDKFTNSAVIPCSDTESHFACEKLDTKEILNQLMTPSTHTGSVGSSLAASLCKVQNDSYGDFADCKSCRLNDTNGSQLKTSRKKAAFTLVEVLVVIAVIGVVAAMTIPNLINRYNEHVTVTKVKKFQSMINQALKMAIVEHGDVDGWDFQNVGVASDDSYYGKSSAPLANYIKPHLKLARDCAATQGCIGSYYYYLSGRSYGNLYDYGSYRRRYYKMVLMDGSALWIRDNYGDARFVKQCSGVDSGTTGICGFVWYDVNRKSQTKYVRS